MVRIVSSFFKKYFLTTYGLPSKYATSRIHFNDVIISAHHCSRPASSSDRARPPQFFTGKTQQTMAGFHQKMTIWRDSQRQAPCGMRRRRFAMGILAFSSLGVVPSSALLHPSRSNNFAPCWAPSSPYVSRRGSPSAQSRLLRDNKKRTSTRSICLVTTMTDGNDDFKVRCSR